MTRSPSPRTWRPDFPGAAPAACQVSLSFTISWSLLKLMSSADAGRDWGQEEKGMTEDEMAGWYH